MALVVSWKRRCDDGERFGPSVCSERRSMRNAGWMIAPGLSSIGLRGDENSRPYSPFMFLVEKDDDDDVITVLGIFSRHLEQWWMMIQTDEFIER